MYGHTDAHLDFKRAKDHALTHRTHLVAQHAIARGGASYRMNRMWCEVKVRQVEEMCFGDCAPTGLPSLRRESLQATALPFYSTSEH